MKTKNNRYFFEKYSKNLSYFKTVKHKSEPVVVYLCPLSLQPYIQGPIDMDMEDQLSVEHVPPKSMGGKPVCLISKRINSTLGHEMDTLLLDQFNFRQFRRGNGPYPVTVEFKHTNLNHIRSNMTIGMNQSSGIPILEFHPGNKNLKKVKVN